MQISLESDMTGFLGQDSFLMHLCSVPLERTNPCRQKQPGLQVAVHVGDGSVQLGGHCEPHERHSASASGQTHWKEAPEEV